MSTLLRASHRLLYFLGIITTSLGLVMTTGCASGGYKLTRTYSSWVNSQQVILRVILYILTLPVFAVTLLIDGVVFNTMDFWNGQVSSGSYKFEKDQNIYFVKHEVLPNNLKRSTIKIQSGASGAVREIVLQELVSGEVEMYSDGVLQARVGETPSDFVVAQF